MSTIASRLAKLEAQIDEVRSPGKMIVISGDRDMTADEQKALFDRENVESGDHDMIIRIVRSFPGDGKPKAIASLISAAPMCGR